MLTFIPDVAKLQLLMFVHVLKALFTPSLNVSFPLKLKK